MNAKTSQLYYALHWERVGTPDGECEIRLAGNADLEAAMTLASLEAQLRDETDIVLHVGDLEFADTTFLRFLLRLRSFSDADRRNVTLAGVTPRLKRVLEVTGLSRLFPYRTATST